MEDVTVSPNSFTGAIPLPGPNRVLFLVPGPNMVKACTECERLYSFALQECPACGTKTFAIVNLDPGQA